MKVRLQPGSVRFRIDDEESERLSATGSLTQILRFSPVDSPLVFQVLAEGTVLTLDISGGTFTLKVPSEDIQTWRSSRQIDIRRDISWPGGSVEIILEKDLDRRPR